MAFFDWVRHHWFALLQTGAVTSAFVFTGITLLLDVRARRVSNLIRLTERHRDLWERMYTQPRLARILDPAADLARAPVTADEEMFVIFVILHLSNTYYTLKTGLLQKPQGLRKDVQLFFSLPIPRAVWTRVRDLQDKPFVAFVEADLQEVSTSRGKRAA
jgi:hypothetical protein